MRVCGLVFDSSPVTECHRQPEHPAPPRSINMAEYHGLLDSVCGRITWTDAAGHDLAIGLSFRGLSQALDALSKEL